MNKHLLLLRKKRLREQKSEFMMLLREYKMNHEMLVLQKGSELSQSKEVYHNNLQNKAFKILVRHCQQRKLSKYLLKRRFKEINHKTLKFNQ